MESGTASVIAWLDIRLRSLRYAIRQKREDEQDDPRVEPEGRGESVEPLLVDEAERRGHEYFGLPQGATPGDHVDQVEEVEGDDESVHRRRDHGRPQERKRDAEELLRARGSVDRGRLVVLLADALKRAGGDDRHERPAEPDVRSEEHTSELQSRRDLVCR